MPKPFSSENSSQNNSGWKVGGQLHNKEDCLVLGLVENGVGFTHLKGDKDEKGVMSNEHEAWRFLSSDSYSLFHLFYYYSTYSDTLLKPSKHALSPSPPAQFQH